MSMADSEEVILDLVTPRDKGVLSNLLELYAHDLSETFGLELGPDGRFGYEKLPLYWSEPERRFPFLIRRGTHLAGFALATLGSPGSDDPQDFDVAEFFIVRRHRRSGVGRKAAFLLWDRFPVRWIVRVAEGNHGGQRFWEGIIKEYTGGAFTETSRPGNAQAWRVFSFDGKHRAHDDPEKLPARPRAENPLGHLSGLLSHLAGDRPVTVEEMNEGIRRQAEKRFKKAVRR